MKTNPAYQIRWRRKDHFLVLLFLIWTALTASAQKLPQDYFRYPLDSLPNLVSPFGGLRDNHFHSGMDLRTNGKEGMPVYAAADGFVSRIKVQRNGYGKALYIEHANGYSTVYGHLQRYNGRIAEWIHRYQYINKTFEFDKIFIKPFLVVKKGDTIGWSGNSGGSSGPHLHYEIRNSKTEKTMNPGLFGLLPMDSLAPVIFRVHVFKFVTEGLLLKNQIVVNARKFSLEDSFWVYKDVLELDPDIYGFGLEAYDYIHNNKDEKGVYEYSLLHNGKLKFRHRLDQFAFDESKYINAHIDYPYYKIEKNRIQKCFIDDGNEFSSYTTDADKGRLNLVLSSYTNGELLFTVKDINGNAYYLKIRYKVGSTGVDKDRVDYEKSVNGKPMIIPGKATTIELKGLIIKMDPKSVYDTVYYNIESADGQEETYSNAYSFHTPNVPVHNAFDIAIEPIEFPKGLESKLLLAYSTPKANKLRTAGGAYEKGWVKGKGSNFGDYCVVMDTTAPTLKQIDFKNEEDINDTLRWDFEVKDEFSGVSSYAAYLNDNWILLDYDPKNSQLTYRFDEMYDQLKARLNEKSETPGSMVFANLKIIVTDQKGNKTERIFTELIN